MIGRRAKKGAEEESSASFSLTGYQKFLIDQLTHPDCTDLAKQFFTLSEGIRISPSGSPRRLERAVKKTVKAHDTLRGAFEQRDGEWVMKLLPSDDITLDVYEHGDVSKEEMYQIVSDSQNDTMEITGPKLCEFRMLRFGSHGDVIIIRVHHAITDGYGMLVMIEDLVRSVLNLPGSGAALSHQEYISDHHNKLPPYTGATAAFWDGLLANPPAPIPFGRFARDLPVGPWISGPLPLHETIVTVSREDYDAISEKLLEADASFFALTIAAIGATMKDLYGTEDYIGRFIASRTSALLARYSGCDLQYHYVRSKISDGDDLIARAAVVRKHMAEADTHRSIMFDDPDNELGHRIKAEVGAAPQVFVHNVLATGKAKASMMSKLFESESAETFKVGPVEVERMHLPRRPFMPFPNDLRVDIRTTSQGSKLIVRGLDVAFDADEVDTIATKIVEQILSVLA